MVTALASSRISLLARNILVSLFGHRLPSYNSERLPRPVLLDKGARCLDFLTGRKEITLFEALDLKP